MNVIADFQQIRAEVKERNILRAAIDKIREIAIIGMPALALTSDLTDDEKALLDIIETCDDAIRQTDTANKEGIKI